MNTVMKKLTLLIMLLTALIITACSGSGPSVAAIGKAAPYFKLQNIEGQSVSLGDFQGNTVLINFWTTWCPPCRSEMPFLQEISEEWSDKGLTVLAIDIGETPDRVKGFMQSYNLALPVLLDTRRDVANKYGVSAYPTTFIVDKDGIIQRKIIGAFLNKEALEEVLSEIMSD